MYLSENIILSISSKDLLMGVTTSNPEARKMLKVPTYFGSLKITVVDCHLEPNCNEGKGINPYVKILISNIYKSTGVNQSEGFNSTFNQILVFPINSCYKPYGRSMQIFVLNKNTQATDKLLAYGLIDLDLFIRPSTAKQNYKAQLKNQFTKIGFLNLMIDFVEEPQEPISFRIDAVDIFNRQKQEKLYSCSVKIIVGEEVLETPKTIYKSGKTSLWNEQSYAISVPQSVTTGKLAVYNGSKLIGITIVDVQQCKKLDQLQSFTGTLRNEDVQIGNLYFSVIRGQYTQTNLGNINQKKEPSKVQIQQQKDPQRKSEERQAIPTETKKTTKEGIQYANFQEMYQDDQMDVFKA